MENKPQTVWFSMLISKNTNQHLLRTDGCYPFQISFFLKKDKNSDGTKQFHSGPGQVREQVVR